MVNFFKSFGRGILYVLVLPLLLVVLAVYAVVSFVVFIIMSIKWLILFFTGRSLFDDLPEDKEAKRILDGNKGEATYADSDVRKDNNVSISSHPSLNNQPIENTPMDQDPFYVPEYLKSKVEEENITKNEEPSIDNQSFNQMEEDKEEEKSFEYSSEFDNMREENDDHYESISFEKQIEEGEDDE